MSKRFEFVTVNGVRLRVDSWGGILPSDIERGTNAKPKELILTIPGNPGVTAFYGDFLSRLHEKTKKHVWILSHGGHDKDVKDQPPLTGNEDLYNLMGQVEQKKRFIETYLCDVDLYLVGHSIGCKMILEVLKNVGRNINIKKCYLLFPTIERMAESPLGRMFTFAHRYFLWLILLGCLIFVKLPVFVRDALLRCYFWATGVPASNIPAALEFIDPSVVRHTLHLADDEMKNVRDLDDSVISSKHDKLKLYYGASDGWVPLSYFEDLKKKYEFVEAEVSSKGFQHAFVLRDSKGMADLLSSWLQP